MDDQASYKQKLEVLKQQEELIQDEQEQEQREEDARRAKKEEEARLAESLLPESEVCHVSCIKGLSCALRSGGARCGARPWSHLPAFEQEWRVDFGGGSVQLSPYQHCHRSLRSAFGPGRVRSSRQGPGNFLSSSLCQW